MKRISRPWGQSAGDLSIAHVIASQSVLGGVLKSPPIYAFHAQPPISWEEVYTGKERVLHGDLHTQYRDKMMAADQPQPHPRQEANNAYM